ncbi:hypothetical protein HJC10_26180 [Corallococcus exiguus]|uniref:hypothetical protein n=1 Tax=Corallococcus exiguus TaxID=83462 RepID=UPI0014717E86|nr:hypothetical protein [Corallococcus exiguus]NNB89672.1 hypothetical protein [Corallococcus exiguus]NNB97195.1 hypothetical protein [Corallococcus exiguus]NNC06326.1 hypothetical protein [Corallococcus exiguus]
MPANVSPQRPTPVRSPSLSKALTRAALLALLGLGAPVAAQQSQAPITEDVPLPVQPLLPDSRVYFTTLNVVRYNPLGLESQNRLVYQKRLSDSPSLLLRDTYASAGASLRLSPAFFKLGPVVELQPLAIFNVRAGYEYVQFFGTFGSVQSYPDSFQPYDDDLRSATNDAAYGTSGHHFFVEPMLQAKVKSLALRSKLAIEYWNMSLHDGGTRGTFYDPTLDTLVPGKGWVLANDTDVLWLAGQWTLGARLSAVWPRYDEDTNAVEPLPGRTLPTNSHVRVGPLVAYAFDTKPGGLMSKPTVLFMAGWYLKHENRMNAMPYLLGGFSFTTELLSGR